MPTPSVFVDTVALLAVANRDDRFHDTVKGLWSELISAATGLVTSDWVLSEFLSGASRRPLRQAACRIVERLRQSRITTIVPATRDAWLRAFDLYSSRPDKEWSFVDCASVLVCQDHGIADVPTANRQFTQAGFRALLRSEPR